MANEVDDKKDNPTKLKFKNAVEESVWISLLIGLLSAPRVKPSSLEQATLWADALLQAYRNRLVDEKPNAK